MMRLTVLGSSGGTPSRFNPASGYLVEAGDATVWMDAGTGTFMALAERVDPGLLSAVVISHIHVDHCSDLYGLYGYLAYGPSGMVPIPVYLPTGAAAHLAAFARAAEEHVFNHVLDLITVEPGGTVTVGDASLTFGAAVHGVPGLVTRIEHDGRSLVYSGDTGPGGDLPALCAGAGTALIEASFVGARSPHHTPHHLAAMEAGSIAAAAGASRLIVTHVSPTLDSETAVTEASAAYGGRVTLAEPGAVFEL
jgi:ribonuclease BN (tRNA processing enzyme)